MLKILYELCSSKRAACIYANYNDTSKFHFGTIIAINDEEIAIQTILPDGEMDGIVVIGVDCINRVETNSQYVEKMKKLCPDTSVCLRNLQIDNRQIMKSILLFALKKSQVVSIELINSGYNDVVGVIRSIKDKECMVEQFDEYGCADGESHFYLKDITKIAILTQEEKIIMRLQENTGDGSVC